MTNRISATVYATLITCSLLFPAQAKAQVAGACGVNSQWITCEIDNSSFAPIAHWTTCASSWSQLQPVIDWLNSICQELNRQSTLCTMYHPGGWHVCTGIPTCLGAATCHPA